MKGEGVAGILPLEIIGSASEKRDGFVLGGVVSGVASTVMRNRSLLIGWSLIGVEKRLGLIDLGREWETSSSSISSLQWPKQKPLNCIMLAVSVPVLSVKR